MFDRYKQSIIGIPASYATCITATKFEKLEYVINDSFKTSDATIVKKRFKIWNDTLDEVIKDDKADKRCFSRAFKQMLYEADSTCAICGQHISTLDDSAVDHIEQYWMGGKTIPDNARLVHRYCNWCRARKE